MKNRCLLLFLLLCNGAYSMDGFDSLEKTTMTQYIVDSAKETLHFLDTHPLKRTVASTTIPIIFGLMTGDYRAAVLSTYTVFNANAIYDLFSLRYNGSSYEQDVVSAKKWVIGGIIFADTFIVSSIIYTKKDKKDETVVNDYPMSFNPAMPSELFFDSEIK